MAEAVSKKDIEDCVVLAQIPKGCFMEHTISDALVFFGATGDLAYKQIFPSLQRMAKRGRLKGPVVGVAKAGWTLEDLKNRDFLIRWIETEAAFKVQQALRR